MPRIRAEICLVAILILIAIELPRAQTTAPGTITGTVTEALTGQPISGALVTSSGSLTATTSADGTYQLTVPPGTYSLTVSVQSRPYQSVFGVLVTSGKTTIANFRVSLPPATGMITGIVRSAATNLPIAGATVRADATHSTITGPDGRYSLSLPTGPYAVSAIATNYTTAVAPGVTVSNQSSTTCNLSLPLTFNIGVVSGRVRDAVTGNPIEGARVSVEGSNLSATTDATGRYELFLIASGYALLASATGHQKVEGGVLVTDQSAPVLDFSMLPGADIDVVHHFHSFEGSLPWSGLLEASDGNFYGTTAGGGSAGHGTVFRMTPAGDVTVLHSFAGGTDGANSFGRLIEAADGNFYGTTAHGGSSGLGTVFRMTPAGDVTVLHAFAGGDDGATPNAALLQAAHGNFYGTTFEGGADNLGTIFKTSTDGLTTTIVHAFRVTDGAHPAWALIQATNGNIYGTTFHGGAAGVGTAFKMTPAGTLTTLHEFAGIADGANPSALVQALDGNFYGTTVGGGAANHGTVFKMTPAGVVSLLHSFTGVPDGAEPYADLVQTADGSLYGTTSAGGHSGLGVSNAGTVFKVTTEGVTAVLASFSGLFDGNDPFGGLVLAANGDLYGTTAAGGASSAGAGTAFRIVHSAIGPAFLTGHVRDATTNALLANATVSVSPGGPSISTDANGRYRLALPAGTYALEVSATNYLSASIPGVVIAPQATVMRDVLLSPLAQTGILTGHVRDATTSAPIANATVAVSPGGTTTTTDATGQYTFTLPPGTYGVTVSATGYTNGSSAGAVVSSNGTTTRDVVLSPLILTGTLIGHVRDAATNAAVSNALVIVSPGGQSTTSDGTGLYTLMLAPGTYTVSVSAAGHETASISDVVVVSQGTAVRDVLLSPIATAVIVSGLHSFAGGLDGAYPSAAMIQATDGNFYGTTNNGGSADVGTVFKMTPAGIVTILHAFTGGADGANPAWKAALIQATDGNFYGTTRYGGSADAGTVFKITPSGVLTTLHAFDGGADGAEPGSALRQAADGSFYGTTYRGGNSHMGTVFRITPAGTLTVLHRFEGGHDGVGPNAALIQAKDGNFYGTTLSGGDSDRGTVFKMTPGGVVTVLSAFGGDLAHPDGNLMQGADGSFYGTTVQDNPFPGAVFKMTPSGVLNLLHEFSQEGAGPSGDLIQAADGNFYGTSATGGAYSNGIIFKLTPAGIFTVLHSFTGIGADGYFPNGGVIQATDGTFYGTALYGGEWNLGTVFRLNVSATNTGTLTGHIRDDSSVPLESASVVVAPGGYAAIADQSGLYTMALPIGVYSVTASAWGYQSTTIANVTVSNQATTTLDLTLSPPPVGTVKGRVLSATSSAPLANALVTVSPVGSIAVTNATGFFIFSLPVGTYTVMASVTAYRTVSQTVTVLNNATTTVDLLLPGPIGALEELHAFRPRPDALSPNGPLLQVGSGDFYGTSRGGGVSSLGTVFKLSASGTVTVVHSFTGADGARPSANLIQANDGNLYGTTTAGGDSSLGTVFRMTPAGTVTVVHVFSGGADGAAPSSGVIQAADGNLYGTTSTSASAGGIIYQLTLTGGFVVLHRFDPGSLGPSGALVQGADGDLYGTTTYNDFQGSGTAFRISSTGTFTVLHSFEWYTEGAQPSTLIQATDGNFYGTTAFGGLGSVFKMTPSGVVTVLYRFAGGSDGAFPSSALTQAADGSFYGTTCGDGDFYSGSVFKITPSGTLTVLESSYRSGTIFSDGSLIQAADGKFYGVRTDWGVGSVYRLAPDGVFTILHTFASIGIEGAHPYGDLLQANDGDFYGTTYDGGAADSGTVFRMTPTGSITVLHSFTGDSDGCHPFAGLVRSPEGDFYGTTVGCGTGGYGSVFKMTPAGAITILHSFTGADGGSAYAALIRATDGAFYGTTNAGSIFKISSTGDFGILHAFNAYPNIPSPGSLIEATDGNFYGASFLGGASDDGTVFRMTPGGSVTILHSFTRLADGAFPHDALIQVNGDLYGTASWGGSSDRGTAFRITTGGVFTVLHTFSTTVHDGANPFGALVHATNGNFYGTTYYGGNGHGTIFEMTPGGVVNIVHAFNGTDGIEPRGALIQASDGQLYGSAPYGGAFDLGIVFRLTLLDPESAASARSARATPSRSAELDQDVPATPAPVPPRDAAGLRLPDIVVATNDARRTTPAQNLSNRIAMLPRASATGIGSSVSLPTGAVVADGEPGAGPSTVTAVATTPARAPANVMQPPTRVNAPITTQPAHKWEIEIFGGAAVTSGFTGTAILPGGGSTFTTTNGEPSRRVSSWYFGDGAQLLNQVNDAMTVSTKIVPIDGLLNASAARVPASHGGGVRLRRVLTPRFTAEITVESSSTGVALSSAGSSNLEASRASFQSAWKGLAAAGQFDNVVVSSASTVQQPRARELSMTGAVNMSLKTFANITPYVTAGAGISSSSDATLTANVTGDYQFRIGGITPVHESDDVTLRYTVTRPAVVGVLGAGFKYSLSRRYGVCVDARALLRPSRVNTTLDSRPSISALAPAGSGASLTNPGIQFSNNPSIGVQSNLSAPAIVNFQALDRAGAERRIQITTGFFWRF